MTDDEIREKFGVRAFRLGEGYTLILAEINGVGIASLGKDRKPIWTGSVATLNATIAAVERGRMN